MEIIIFRLQFQIISVTFIFLCCFNTSSCNQAEPEVMQSLAKYGAYYSLDQLTSALKQDKYRDNSNATSLLQIYEEFVEPRLQENLTTPNNHPFIVVEGFRLARNRILSQMLALSLGAKILPSVPAGMSTRRFNFENDPELKGIFFALGIYVNSFLVKDHVMQEPVVVDGYWLHEAAYNMAYVFKQDTLPPVGSKLYKFPESLLKPDLIIYYNTETFERKDLSVDFVHKLSTIYGRIEGVQVHDFFTPRVSHADINFLRDIIKQKIGQKFTHLNYL